MSGMTPTAFTDWLKSLSFPQFTLLFGTMFSATEGAFKPWKLWRGSRRPTTAPDGPGKYGASVIRAGIEYFAGQYEALVAIQRAAILWVAKARQKGMSEMAAMYAIYICLTEPKSVVLVFSADASASKAFLADRVLKKLEGMIVRRDPAGDLYPWGEVPWIDGKDKIQFRNGSVIEAHSSDNTGPISRSPRLVIFDEIRTYPFKDAKEMWTTMMGARGVQGRNLQAICISTPMAGSWFNEMTRKILDGAIEIAEFLFLPDDIDPARDAEFRRQQLQVMGGDETALRREHAIVVDDLFASHEGLVIGSWDPAAHVRRIPVTWDDGEEFILGYDHGHTQEHPAVCGFYRYNRYENFLYRFDEVFMRGKELTEVGPAIRAKVFYWQDRGAPGITAAIADTAIFNDLGMKTVGEVLIEETGIQWGRAFKHDKAHSLDLLQQRFFHRRIAIDPRCGDGITQLSNLRYKEGKDKPEELEDDVCDECRYVNTWVEKGARPRREEPLERKLRELAEARATGAAPPVTPQTEAADVAAFMAGGVNTWQSV